MEPSPTANNGHNTNGRFSVGNQLGRGNPHAAQVARLRSVMLAAVSEDDLRTVVATLVEKAKGGDVGAIKLLFDRTLGKVVAIESSMANGITPRVQKLIDRIRSRIDADHDVDSDTGETLTNPHDERPHDADA